MANTRVVLLASLVAGILPVGLVVVVEIVLGPVPDSAYPWSAVLGPPLVGLAFAKRLRLGALWVTLGGFLVELLTLVAIGVALSSANWG